MHSFLYSFLPFGILLLVNLLLIRVLRQESRPLSQSVSFTKKNKLSINVSMMFMTLLFVLFTCPSAICSQFYNKLILTYNDSVILYASDCFGFSYHALNIIILCAFNKQFCSKFKEIFICKVHRAGHSFQNSLSANI